MCLFFHGKFFPINFDVMEGMPLKKIVSYVFFLPLFFLLVSCSKGDYVNVIPENSIAVASIDAQSLFGGDYGSRLGKILKVEKEQDCGVDISEKLYMFETVDGNVGIAAKVSDKDKLVDWLDYLAKNNYCTAIIKQDKYWFTIFKNSWVIGFSSDALVALGPVLPAALARWHFVYYRLPWSPRRLPREYFRLFPFGLPARPRRLLHCRPFRCSRLHLFLGFHKIQTFLAIPYINFYFVIALVPIMRAFAFSVKYTQIFKIASNI